MTDNNIQKFETKRDKFVRIAEYRVNQVLDGLRKIGNLSDKRNYEYNEKDIDKIFSVLSKEITKTKSRFDKQPKSVTEKFRL
jgi:hypothetical protein